MLDVLYFALAGLGVGLLVGMTGIGGGSLLAPVLLLGFGQSPSVAVGTDLVFAATTKLAATAATAALGSGRRIDWSIVGRLALGSLPAAAAVIGWLWLTPRPPAAVDHLIGQALAVMLLVAGVGLLLHTHLQRLGVRATAAALARAEPVRPVATILAGAALGGAVTLTSVGSGALGTVALLYLYPLRLPSDRLVATHIAHALPLTILAGLGHASLGHVNVPMLGSLLLGSIPGVLVGGRLMTRTPQGWLRTAIAVMLILTSAKLLFF